MSDCLDPKGHCGCSECCACGDLRNVVDWQARVLVAEEALRESEAENARLRGALGFYADPAEWFAANNVPRDDWQLPDFYYAMSYGDRATAALAAPSAEGGQG